MDGTIQEGTVISFNSARGYGFLRRPGLDADVFVHYSIIPGRSGNRNLDVGDVIQYVEMNTHKGVKASSIISIKKGVQQ